MGAELSPMLFLGYIGIGRTFEGVEDSDGIAVHSSNKYRNWRVNQNKRDIHVNNRMDHNR
ncbi:hypothetical protein PAXRUDRAFT_219289 [Paxillus rubicundulus Ve08.2h10]|uniref:Uncharacterized protein n=1 Tax=Paxillus rubicundulus Ve08.2h10 TaxID=930991 RepID=A0A0D0DPG0_9AGAM|nr:hypothetical protein PAXRUDRAFT_219289 [Paxillus rubicundulus Ve08.2h10]